jgi:choline dehydrogenase-like flavoprotein
VTGVVVDRVHFAEGRAVAVEYLAGGDRLRVGAAREIVLSAGVIGSPNILNRSGIGDGDELGQLGISVQQHLPGTGANLQDHICVDVNYSSPVDASVGFSARALPRLAWGAFRYLATGVGFPAAMPMDSGAFVRSDPSLDRPDVQLIFAAVNRPPTGRIGIGHGFGMTPMVLRPKSKGTVKLSNTDPRADPIIDPRFFDDQADLELLLYGLRLSLTILAQPAFERYRGTEFAPGAHVRSDAALKDFIRATAHTAYHPVGTCKMGSDQLGVVDSELRVRGVQGLRVADASIMPTIIGGNTNAPSIMIGEKAADMMLGKPPLSVLPNLASAPGGALVQ